ncbi:MAG: hypothetical protein JO024_09635 [Candidatus Eremiobacteraeota bacterium]|nr:hypothetical protein [Candidatus Eremiobacteraeota bacterium]MBV9737457.1 hypothetical protein [Candidatus Eremiobacteraeota bacterium]
MFAYFFVAAIVAAAPQPAPTPTVALKEIGHVRATAACAELAVHANSAISSALRNDLLLTQTIGKLHSVDLDGNPITRRNNLQELGDLAKDLRAQAVSGDREVAHLRDIAAKSSDPEQKQELKKFADELGGALYRQKRIANDLNGLLAAFDYHDMSKLDENTIQVNMMTIGLPTLQTDRPDEKAADGPLGRINNIPHQTSDNILAGRAANDFELRMPDITNDEGQAAEHTAGAVSGC